MRIRFYFLLLSMSACSLWSDQKVLMIGNSYAAGTSTYLQGFLSNTPGNENFTLTAITPGGQTLYGHFGTASTLNTVNTNVFEHIILQEQSQHHSLARYLLENWLGLGDNGNFFQAYTAAWVPPETANEADYAARVYWGTRQLIDYIRGSTSGGARIHAFQSWGRTPAAAANDLGWLSGTNEQKSLRHFEHNRLMSRDMGFLDANLVVARIGEAWRASMTANTDINLYNADGSHGSANGYYLAAAILYQNITGLPASQNPYTGGLSATVRTRLLAVADQFFVEPVFKITSQPLHTSSSAVLNWTGRPLSLYWVETSVNLKDWEEMTGSRQTAPAGQTDFSFTLPPFSGKRFYRVAGAYTPVTPSP